MTNDGATDRTIVSLPQLGESVSEGTIVAWLVTPGDEVAVDQPIAEVSTDKVDTEIPSPVAGTVTRYLVDIDDEVAVGQPIVELRAEADGGAPADRGATGMADKRPGPPPPPRASSTQLGPPRQERLSPKVKRLLREHDLDPAEIPGTGAGGRITPDDVVASAGASRATARTTEGRLSPLVKRLLREHGLTSAQVRGTGTDGRITPADVRAAAEGLPDRPEATPAREHPAADREPVRPAAAVSRDTAHDERTVVEPLSRTRKVIAERMLTSLQTTAQLTAAVEADVTRIMNVRARLRSAARIRYGFAPSPLAFIAKATCRALARHPVVNASIDTDAGTVTYHRQVDLGIAVDTPAGLVVPVIADAQELGVLALQGRINDLADRARERKLTPDDVRDGTFTVTNTGSGGTLFDTPILNPPQAAILATPRIEKRPVVVTDASGNDSIAIRHRTYLCLSYDHRLIDGADAARFLTDLADQLDGTDWEQELAELMT